MLLAAIYARKSTDQNVADEEKSVTRQVQHARAYAMRKGWQVAEEHIYTDDGISGAEFIKRPGFLRLMNSIKPRPAFQVLIMSEESRLGREQIETAYALKQIMVAGVRVWFYLEGRERTLDSAMDKVMLSLTTFASEMERERAKVRTRDAMQRKASRGHVAARQVLRKLQVGRLTLWPIVREDGRYYEIAGQASYGRLLAGINGVQGMVPPAGMARLDSTQLLLGAGGLVIQSDFDIEPGTTTGGGGANLTSALPLLRGSSSTTWRATGSWAWR